MPNKKDKLNSENHDAWLDPEVSTVNNSDKYINLSKKLDQARAADKIANETKMKEQLALEQQKAVIEQKSAAQKVKKSKKQPKTKVEDGFFALIIRYFKKEWRLGTITVILAILMVLCSVVIPLLTEQMTADIAKKFMHAESKNYWGISWEIILYISLGVVIFNAIVSYLSQYFAFVMSKRIEIDLRNKTLEALVRQDISYYSDKKIGEIITTVISDTQIVGDQMTQVPVTLLRAVLTIIGASVMMFIFEPLMAGVVLATFCIVLLIMISTFGFVRKAFIRLRKVLTAINGQVTDRISNVRLVKASGTENYEKQYFNEKHKDYYKEIVKTGRLQSLMVTILFSGISVIQFVSIATAMLIYGNGDPDAASTFFSVTFASFTLAQGIMVGPLFQVVMSTMGIAQASVSSTRLSDAINAKSILNPHYFDGVRIVDIHGTIQFKDVSFAYPEKPENLILPTFDFTFEQGKSYAFVGETGSGKSTISRLLLRFYDPTTGDVFINDNINLKDVNLSSYLDHVGYVEQDPQILYGDVYENVKYSRFNATDEEVVEACKKAELHELIESWTDGYNTILGEHGLMLSGGQKQRLIIARMFLKDPKILILDEATSALDNIVEKEIQEKLEILMVGRTTISIAHRLSTIKNADQIIVLGRNGQGIVQTGTFDSLKKTKGHFKDLYEAGLMD